MMVSAMKKTLLLHPGISRVVASMGHTDRLVVADAGLPIPSSVERIDLAVSEGVPGFVETLAAVLSELKVEQVLVAAEMRQISPAVYSAIETMLPDVPIREVPHEAFKAETRSARAVIRTGEFSPYANIILCSGVVF